jgi:uncharacterized membrane protein
VGGENSHAVLWYHGSMTELGMLAGGTASAAVAINESGHVLGTSNVQPHSAIGHPFLWWHGALRDLTALGVPASSAHSVADINDRGQILADLLFSPRGG